MIKKSKTGHISLSSDEYRNYDIFSVYMSHPESEKQFLFESYKEGRVYALAWNENLQRFDTPVGFSVFECSDFIFTGSHFYKGHRVEFKSLGEFLYLKGTFIN